MELILEIPDNVNVDSLEMKRIVGAKLYESGKLSLGQVAELAGMSKISFAEILCDYNVSLINYPVSEIIKDAAAI
jgi:predicted HTH domain antitoxin